MAISVISVSSDLLEDSMRTPAGRVILFGTIPTTIPNTTLSMTSPTTHIDTTPIPTVSPTIPPSPDYTPASLDYSPASDTEFDPSEDPSLNHISPLPATSSFLSSTDDSSGSDILDTSPSPTHGIPFTKTTFLLIDALSDSASSRSSFDHSLPASSSGTRPSHHFCSLVPSTHRSSTDFERPSHDSSSASPFRKRSRSPAASVPLSSPRPGALSYAHADLLPSPKRIKSPESETDLEDCSEDSFELYVPREVGFGVDFKDKSTKPSRSRGTDLEMDVDVKRSNRIEIDPEIEAEIDECITYADALRDRGIDARVVVEAIDREEIKTGMRGPVEVRVDRVTHPVVVDDILEPAQEGAVEAIEGIQRDQGQRIEATGQQSADILKRIQEMERDNRRLRDMMDVESHRCILEFLAFDLVLLPHFIGSVWMHLRYFVPFSPGPPYSPPPLFSIILYTFSLHNLRIPPLKLQARRRTRDAGSVWGRVGKVVGISWSSGGVVRSREEGRESLAGKLVCVQWLFKRGEDREVYLGFFHNWSLWFIKDLQCKSLWV
nr:hypothetical protein [Tanacetum cinerariifolium]